MLSRLLFPKTVAVVGASEKPGKVGREVMVNLTANGFQGTVVPINPRAHEVCGRECYASALDYPGTIDLAIIVVPPPAVLSSVEHVIAKGAGAVVVITAGFKEVSADGLELEQKVAGLCKDRGVRLLGPNCLGLINTENNLNASFAGLMPGKGGISVISQSGALCTAILDWSAEKGLGLSKLISMGNKADLTETDFLASFSADDDTKVIVGYLESIDGGGPFMKAAEEASSKKPIVIFKSGVTTAGGKAASSHTGSLAGADMAYGAAFRRAGVVRADTFEAMFDYAMAFAMQPLPLGNRVAIITNAGGPGIMAADAVELAGLQVKPLADAHAAALKEKLPVAASVANPIDVLGDAKPDRFVDALRAAQSDDSIDAIVVILTPQAMTEPVATARLLAEAVDGSKPVVASYMGGYAVREGREELITRSIPEYPSPERAVQSLKAMWEYASWLRRPQRVLTRFPVNRKRVDRIIRRHQKTGRLQVGEAAAKDILRAYDFNVPNGALAATAEEAKLVAAQVGFPVAMKIASPDIVHKSDMGGVKLNLANEGAVEDAFDLMMLRMGQRAPNANIDGVYIEQMCKGGREVILGMTRDPQFGPMLMFGLGGIFVEVMKDVTFNIAPITHGEAMQMLKSTKSFALLKGVRGEARVDLSAVATALQRISQLVTEFPEIAEMDINPFMVGGEGGESVAADARITLLQSEKKDD